MSLLLALFVSFASAGSPSASTSSAKSTFPNEITVTTSDGQALHASLGAPARADKGVLFVHMAGRNKEDWLPLAEKFYRQGDLVLAVDLRGHGANVTGTPPTLAANDWAAMVADVRAGVDELRKRGAKKVAIVGAEVGANLAIVEAADDPGVVSLVLLSPGLDYHGIVTAEATRRLGRPLLFVASKDDSYGTRSATTLDGLSSGPHTLQVFDAAGKGTRMFNHEPTLESQILGFVATSWTAQPTAAAPATLDVKVHSDEIQTDGPRIGDGTAPK